MRLYSLLRNQIDIERVPFSDRGSRILVFKEVAESRLYVKFAERLVKLDPDLEAHLDRPCFIRDLSLLGPNEAPLEFSLETAPGLLEFDTSAGKFELAFQDEFTLAFGLPPDSLCGLRFEVQMKAYQVKESEGEYHSSHALYFSTNGQLVKEKTTQVKDGYVVEILVHSQGDCTLQLHIGGGEDSNHTVPPFSAVRSERLASWRDWFEQVPAVAERCQPAYAYAWWVLANNLVSPRGNLEFEGMMPSKAKYIGLWLWDSALHALAFRHIDPELARNQIRIFLRHQLSDGMLPDVVFDEGIVSEIDHPIQARVTKPPILAWAALKVHQAAPELSFLKEIYSPLARWNAWWFHQSAGGPSGLAQYNHPYSSGLDDNPLWDQGMPVVSPDLNTYLYIQMKALEQIAREIGFITEATGWAERSEALLRRMVHELWDDDAGLFRAQFDGKPVPVKTPFGLYPLWTGKLTEDIQSRLLNHLQNPDEFWGRVMLPTVARDDPKFDPEVMWRGPVWANINYFFIEALQQLGRPELAGTLRDSTLRMISKHPGIHEYYNPETGRPPATAAVNFGWTAAVYIELAIQASAESNPVT